VFAKLLCQGQKLNFEHNYYSSGKYIYCQQMNFLIIFLGKKLYL